MKNIYFIITTFSFLILSCSKDFLKSYDRRIVGTWHITDINTTGFGGDASNLPFKEGQFTFNADGTLIYTSAGNSTYNGTWNIEKKTVDDTQYQSLEISVVNFSTQSVLGEYYDDIEFTSTDHFKARIHQGLHSFVTHFRR
jgi:hypothetical protein